MSVNKVILIGNLGRDPETKYFDDGNSVTNAAIATSEKWKDKNSGEQKEKTEWHRLVFSGRLAEIAGEYLRKGSKIYVEGKLTTRKWQDQDGNDKYQTEVRVVNLQMLGGQSGGEERNQQQQPQQHHQAPQNNRSNGYKQAQEQSGFSDDIPF